MKNTVIERAYELINTPINPTLTTPLELTDSVNYFESEAGETVEYFKSPDTDREGAGLYSIDANGSITYHKINLKSPTAIQFTGLQSKLETVLLDDIMNSKDQTALADVKQNLILQMDNRESRLTMDLVLSVAGQEITKTSGEDLLDVIIKMRQKIYDYSTDYILIVAPDVMNAIETYDKSNANNFNYKMSIMEELAKLGIKKVVKCVGDDLFDDVTTPILASGKAILIGRNSKLLKDRPITLCRRKFAKAIAENSGAEEGAVRLVSIVPTPYVVNASGKQTLGYGIIGYSSISIVLLNYRTVAWSSDILV